MLYQFFPSLQGKQCAIITYKHCIYELLHELSNELRLNLKKLGDIKKVSELHDALVCSIPAEIKILLILAKNS